MDNLIHGFKIISKTALDEMQAEGVFARHCATGLEVYHIHNDDNENLFAFAFMTAPENGSGVAHILEHSVLCGSKNYPLKDPFLILSKQSVKTFLNAMTFPDKTVYPASSILEKDYFNLMSVYGDAVFFPLLKRETFEQEGHRLELDEAGKPYFSGVVLNEMRGAYADFDSGVDRELRYSLLQNTVYAHDSGGFPPDIVKLSYEDFCAFHKKYYHPVNCKVFLYGNIETEKQLAFLQERFLRFFEPAEKPSLIPAITPYPAPRVFSATAPAGEGKNPGKLTVTMNWLLPESADIDRLMDCMFLEELLLGHDGAPLQKRLLDCPFAEDVYPYNGGQADLKNICFTLGLADIDKSAEGQFEAFILSGLEEIARNGFEPQLIETALNSLDFYNREITRSGGPFSLVLMRRALRGWIHGFAPEASLRSIPAFQRLKQRLSQNPHYAQDLIRTLLLNNPHRTTVSVRPDIHFCENIDARLAQEAHQAAQSLGSVEHHSGSAEQTAATVSGQKADANTGLDTNAVTDAQAQHLIPHISKEELPPVEPPIPERLEYFGKVPVIIHEQPTNGITYLDLAIPADSLSAEDYAYLTLYTATISSMGTKTQPWDAVAAEFAYLTGGFSAVTFSAGKHRTAEAPVFFDNALRAEDVVDRDWILIRAKMLPEYIEPAVNRIFSYLNGISFADEKRLKDIFIQLKNDLDPLPSYSGHTLTALYAASAYSGSKRAENLWMGIPQLRFLRGQYAALEQKPAAIGELARKLEEIHRKLMRSGLIVKVCGTSADVSVIKKALTSHLSQFDFPHRSTGGFRTEAFERPAALSAFPSAVQVGFAAQLVPAVFDENEYGASIVYAQRLETGALWEAIRVKGGAYGVSAYPDSATALFTMTTYRDPAPLKSLRSIRDCIEKSIAAPLTDSELEALITGTYSTALQPRTPAQRSAAAFSRLLNGITHQARMQTIESIISCTRERMNRLAERLAASVSGSTALSTTTAGAISGGTAAVICSDAVLRQTADSAGLPLLSIMPSI
ncbi:peptidase M16 [Treponema sp. OMZ 305]|uniref:insulinase family protein n=1 Tax=Treponema sp. OMZ 305 TaxID=1659192 RepID=UPI0020A30AE9|nr:insulinase family protein [Treponema sp. OMZ 305]UTC58282.1 peptidase M16 [Treponema sp. OMZ 305]